MSKPSRCLDFLSLKSKSKRLQYINTDGRNIFDQSINDDIKTNESIRKIATGHEDDYITGCLLSLFQRKL